MIYTWWIMHQRVVLVKQGNVLTEICDYFKIKKRAIARFFNFTDSVVFIARFLLNLFGSNKTFRVFSLL